MSRQLNEEAYGDYKAWHKNIVKACVLSDRSPTPKGLAHFLDSYGQGMLETNY
jgi:hypothetical protein